jgi:hypothetical protein
LRDRRATAGADSSETSNISLPPRIHHLTTTSHTLFSTPPQITSHQPTKQDAARRARERAAGLSTDGADFAADDGAAADALLNDGAGAGQTDAAALEKAYRRDLAKEVAGAAEALDEEEGGDDGSEGEEGAGQGRGAKVQKRARGAEQEDGEEGGDLNAMMMSRKTRKFYERIQRAQAGKAERVGVLEARRAALDEKEGKAPVAAAPKKRGKQEAKRVETIEPAMKKRRP